MRAKRGYVIDAEEAARVDWFGKSGSVSGRGAHGLMVRAKGPGSSAKGV